jgi:hypothetical protein
MIISIRSPSRLLMIQDQKLLTPHWLACSGWGKECVYVVWGYEGGRFIRKWQCCAKVDILRLTVGYLNATINGKTWNTEPEIGTNGSSHTWRNPRVNWYRSGFGLQRHCGSGFWSFLEPNRTVLVVLTRTAGRFPGPIAIPNNDLINHMDGVMRAVAWKKNQWMEDLFFAVKLSWPKLSKYYAEVTPTMGRFPIAVHILFFFRTLQSSESGTMEWTLILRMRYSIQPNTKRPFCSMWKMNTVPNIKLYQSIDSKPYRAVISSLLHGFNIQSVNLECIWFGQGWWRILNT